MLKAALASMSAAIRSLLFGIADFLSTVLNPKPEALKKTPTAQTQKPKPFNIAGLGRGSCATQAFARVPCGGWLGTSPPSRPRRATFRPTGPKPQRTRMEELRPALAE